jgi:5-formyltetrahydrofolate cyclo-ligase
LDSGQVEHWSHQIVRHLLASPWIQPGPGQSQCDSVGLFVAMRQEVDLSQAWQTLQGIGIKLCFPRMVSCDHHPDLEFLAIPDQDDPQAYMTTSRFGVREPQAVSIQLPGQPVGQQAGQQTSPCDPEIILMPGLAFDRHGNRLGWGKGYYDFYLSRRAQAGGQRPVCIGVAFPFQIIEQVPASAWDIPVDYLLSPAGILRVR